MKSLVEIVFSEFQFLSLNIRTLLLLGFTCTPRKSKWGAKCKFCLAGIWGHLNQLLSHNYSLKGLSMICKSKQSTMLAKVTLTLKVKGQGHSANTPKS